MPIQEGHWVVVDADSSVCKIPYPPTQTGPIAGAAPPVIPLLLLIGLGVGVVLMARY